MKFNRWFTMLIFIGAAHSAAAGDVITVKKMSMELARDIAQKSVDVCRGKGYQVSVVVVDRNAVPQVIMRDVHASRFTLRLAESKANAVILSGVDSGELRKNRSDIRPELNQLDGILLMQGAVQIRAAGSLIGAVGVSGAPGGNLDEECARAAVESVRERLEFADD